MKFGLDIYYLIEYVKQTQNMVTLLKSYTKNFSFPSSLGLNIIGDPKIQLTLQQYIVFQHTYMSMMYKETNLYKLTD